MERYKIRGKKDPSQRTYFDGIAVLYVCLIIGCYYLTGFLSSLETSAFEKEGALSSRGVRTIGVVVEHKKSTFQDEHNRFGEIDQDSIYEYKDRSGRSHHYFSFGEYPLGSTIELIYDPTDPSLARPVGNIHQDSIGYSNMGWVAFGAIIYFAINLVGKLFFNEKDFLGRMAGMELFSKE